MPVAANRGTNRCGTPESSTVTPRASSDADRVGEHRRTRRVERRDVRHPQDRDPDVADLGELEQGRVRAAEEQRALEAEGDDVLVEQGALLGAVVGGVDVVAPLAHRRPSEVLLAQHGRAGELAQGQTPGGHDAEDDRGGQVEHDGGEEGQGKDEAVAAGGPDEGPQARHLDHAHGRRDEDAGECGQRDPRDDVGEGEHDDEQHHGVHDRGQPRARAGADVDGGARDRRGRRDAAEQRRHEVGQALTEQLAVGVVARRDAHRVGDRGRQQALQGGERGHGEGRERRARAGSLHETDGQREGEQLRGERTDRATGRSARRDDHRGRHHGQQGHRHRRAQPREPSRISGRHPGAERERRRGRAP